MLENLIIAMESDGQVVDLGRVAGFMQKVSPPHTFGEVLYRCLSFSF